MISKRSTLQYDLRELHIARKIGAFSPNKETSKKVTPWFWKFDGEIEHYKFDPITDALLCQEIFSAQNSNRNSANAPNILLLIIN